MSGVVEVRELPAEVYDAIERAANEFGGIGAYKFFEWENGVPVIPICAVGCVEWPDVDSLDSHLRAAALERAGVTTDANDAAVISINRGLDRATDARVPFADWCAALGVVRSTQPHARPGAGLELAMSPPTPPPAR